MSIIPRVRRKDGGGGGTATILVTRDVMDLAVARPRQCRSLRKSSKNDLIYSRVLSWSRSFFAGRFSIKYLFVRVCQKN